MCDCQKCLITEAEEDGIERICVGALIVRKNKENTESVLLLKRTPGDYLGGIWELPSGKVGAGEDLNSALKREVFEETGLEVKKILDHIGFFDYTSQSGKRTRQFNFVVEVESGDELGKPQLNPLEHSEFKWIEYADLNECEVSPEVKELIRKYFEEFGNL
ncbi:MAG: NUDIX hydrolase [Deltaproteobacteria bacterium]|nr:NUDIX hydrolase [Deltaproteobacteria bacterium]